MMRSRFYSFVLIGLITLTLVNCEHTPLGSGGEYHWRGYTFPIGVKTSNGIAVRYVIGLVIFTTKPEVTVRQLQPIVKKFDGKILEVWQSTAKSELDLTMKIPFSLDPFSVASQLSRSTLIRYAEPVFVSTPE